MALIPARSDLSWLLDDAKALYAQGRKHGAILLLVCAVDALARARDPSVTNNKVRFVDFLHSKTRRKGRPQIHNIGIPQTGAIMAFEELLYKFLRCPLVHEGARLKVEDPDIAVCLDWDTVPNGVKCDWDNNVVLLGGEYAFELLSDAVMHELEVD